MTRTDYDLIPYSWDGHLINDGTNYKGGVLGVEWGLPPSGVISAGRVNNWPVVTSVERQARTITLLVTIRASNKRTARDNLLAWFDPDDTTPKNLIIEDADGTNDRYVVAVCAGCTPTISGSTGTALRDQFRITLITHGDPLWKLTTATTPATWSASVSGETHAFTNSGTADAYPIITIQPTAAKSGTDDYLYKQFIPWRWKALYAATRYPMDVVDTWDTTALVVSATATTLNGDLADDATTIPVADASSFPTRGMGYITDADPGDEQVSWTGKTGNNLTGCTRGIGGTSALAHSDGDAIAVSKALANGADVRIEVDGVDVDHWLDGWNGASTKIWANLDWAAEWHSTITAAITDAQSVTSITVDDSVDNAPASGILVIDNEAFAYSAKNNKTKTFTIAQRAALGTSAGNHSAAATIWWCQHAVYIKYGDAGASARSVDSNHQPIFELDLSTNGSWVYESFGEDDGLRAGQWQRSTDYGTPDYHGGNQASVADPWTDFGLAAVANERGRYYLWNPCGITAANFTNGEKYSSVVANYLAGISSWTGTRWQEEYLIPAPGVASTWEAWSRNETITAGRYKISLACRAKNASTTNKVEAADCTVTLNSSYTPTIGTMTEAGMYNLSLTIENTTTSKSILLSYKMAVNDTLEVDTRPALEGGKTVTDTTHQINAFNALTLVEEHRRDWLKLQPGANTWSVTETGLAGMDITISYYERYY